ncbi:MAG: hypothetical protein KDC68_08595 [Gelidibacter sp.]|nr:hypothetical protein [Gelidibacter sp.]
MGFGGSVQSMIAIIKNNEKMRSSRKKFKKTLGGYGSHSKPEYNFPKATPEILQEIRERLKKEQKKRVISQGVIWTLLLVAFVLLITFI